MPLSKPFKQAAWNVFAEHFYYKIITHLGWDHVSIKIMRDGWQMYLMGSEL